LAGDLPKTKKPADRQALILHSAFVIPHLK